MHFSCFLSFKLTTGTFHYISNEIRNKLELWPRLYFLKASERDERLQFVFEYAQIVFENSAQKIEQLILQIIEQILEVHVQTLEKYFK